MQEMRISKEVIRRRKGVEDFPLTHRPLGGLNPLKIVIGKPVEVEIKPATSSLCKCGCGKQVTKPGNVFLFGHHARMKEVRAKMSNSRRILAAIKKPVAPRKPAVFRKPIPKIKYHCADCERMRTRVGRHLCWTCYNATRKLVPDTVPYQAALLEIRYGILIERINKFTGVSTSKVSNEGRFFPRLNREEVKEIRELLHEGLSKRTIAERYKVHYSTINRINAGNTHGNMSGIPETGVMKVRKYRQRLDRAEILGIRESLKDGLTQGAIAENFNVLKDTVSRINMNKAYIDVK